MLQKVKSVYLTWYSFLQLLPKPHRYTLGEKIDNYFIELIESIAVASFLNKQEKLPYVRHAIKKTDTIKILLMILWETKSLDNKKYITLSVHLDEIGKMLGGWHGQLIKQNSPSKLPGEK